MPHRRTILLSGAPQPKSLEATTETLLDELLPAFKCLSDERGSEIAADAVSSGAFPRWRSVVLGNQEDFTIYDSFARADLAGKHQPHSLEISVPGYDGLENAENGFLEHSWLAHEDMISATDTSFADNESKRDGDSPSMIHTPTQHPSFISSITESFNSPGADVSALMARLPITDLGALPSHHHLSRLYPQTVTPNLLAGVISATGPRTVTLRSRQAMEIVELLLGDDTATGFRVTFWLAPPPPTSTAAERGPETRAQQHAGAEAARLRRQLLRLRRGDVVLLTHVALSSFRSKVCGQSLRRRQAGIATGLFPIEEHIGAEGAAGSGKLGRVRQWVSDFVGPPVRPVKRKCAGVLDGGFNRKICLGESLPEDTQ